VFDPVVITVGSFHAGTASNVIPDEVVFAATVRSFSSGTRAAVQEASLSVVRGIASAHGLSADAEFVDGYPVTVNHPGETTMAEQTVTEVLGGDRLIRMPDPLAGSEDFSYVLEEVPGSFLFLGACPPGADPATAPFNHSGEAVFDDAALSDGAALLAELALRRLAVS
jgi:metal-dependent amidase/aminoacylase/carboxypeptidase family protein